MKEKENMHKFKKPYASPEEAKTELKKGLDELKNLQMVLESVNGFQIKINKKERQVKNIISAILRNIDEDSEQGQILQRNLDGEYDDETLKSAIQQIFDSQAKTNTEMSKKLEADFVEQISRMGEDSRYKKSVSTS
jgi:uncharacterized protein YwgA